MLKIFFVTMLSCTSPDCHEIAHVIAPTSVTYEHCASIARGVFESSTLVQAIGCKKRGKEELALWIVRAPEL